MLVIRPVTALPNGCAAAVLPGLVCFDQYGRVVPLNVNLIVGQGMVCHSMV